MSYWKFAAMIATSTVVMFILMYLNTYLLPHVFYSETRAYMAVLMGATMFVQQKMTPTTADPAQQKIFMFMPIIFTVMFLWAPAGLVIYWLMSNIMTIGQQYLTNHLIAAPSRKGPGGTSSERRAKMAGSASTPKALGQ